MLLNAWLIHTVTRKRLALTPNSGRGEPTYDAVASTIRARVEKKAVMVRRADGTYVQSSHVMATQAVVLMSDIFWFPSIAGEPADDTTKQAAARRPLAVPVATTKSGLEALFEVYF